MSTHFLLTYPCFQYIISCCVHSLRENLSSHNLNLKNSLFSAVSQPKISKSPHKNQACHRWHGIFSGFYARHIYSYQSNRSIPDKAGFYRMPKFNIFLGQCYFWDSVVANVQTMPPLVSERLLYYTVYFLTGREGGGSLHFLGFQKKDKRWGPLSTSLRGDLVGQMKVADR